MKRNLEAIFDCRFTDTRDNWRSLCPFHLESTPSFYIHRDDLIGHCFGCGVAGRLDILVARYKGCSPAQARALLGLKTLPWLDDKVQREIEPTYPNSWIHAWKRISNHPYLEERGYSNETLEAFECRWDPSTKRVVFPHIGKDGRVLGAVGRATDGRDPKYLFYWNCDKGREIWTHRKFWLNDYNHIIVCEGILDAARYFQAGYPNVCALIGASATTAQLKTLREYGSATIALDTDAAGHRGALAIGQALRRSCVIDYAIYPEHCKDAGGLTESEIEEVLESTITPLEMKLHA